MNKRIRKLVRQIYAQETRRVRDRLADRAALAARIAEYRQGNVVNVYRWGRDCDLAESWRVEQWPANVIAFERCADAVYEWAEGPETIEIISADEANKAEAGFRDRAAEMMGY